MSASGHDPDGPQEQTVRSRFRRMETLLRQVLVERRVPGRGRDSDRGEEAPQPRVLVSSGQAAQHRSHEEVDQKPAAEAFRPLTMI